LSKRGIKEEREKETKQERVKDRKQRSNQREKPAIIEEREKLRERKT
jgi:hypothetical protein